MRRWSDIPLRLWREPRAPDPPPVGLGDGLLVAFTLGLLIIEASARPELEFTHLSWWAAAASVAALPARRAYPLAMALVGFGASTPLDGLRVAGFDPGPTLNTTIVLLVLPYALLRWASGRHIVVGVGLVLVAASFGLTAQPRTPFEVAGGLGVLMTPMTLGVAMRFRARARARALEQVKLQERAHLARDLHDTVAHHVSAIAIRAQAGLAVAEHAPEGAVEALKLIEAEASRSLAAMRSMVRTLRDDGDAERTPQPRVTDLTRLAETSSAGPKVQVDLRGPVDDLAAMVSATAFRIVQESVTNARRHARGATRVHAEVVADESEVRISISDDGEPPAAPRGLGFGLVGMAERATLLGGRCEAGPGPERGWRVTATLPRKGRSE